MPHYDRDDPYHRRDGGYSNERGQLTESKGQTFLNAVGLASGKSEYASVVRPTMRDYYDDLKSGRFRDDKPASGKSRREEEAYDYEIPRGRYRGLRNGEAVIIDTSSGNKRPIFDQGRTRNDRFGVPRGKRRLPPEDLTMLEPRTRVNIFSRPGSP